MSVSALNARLFQDETAAYAWVEARLWPEGPVCPHCGGVERISKMQGKSTRIGTYKCYQCRKPFTVKVGTVFEDSHVSMRLWLQAMFLMCSSKKGISSNQLHRTLGVTLKTAWFMSHRIREAMRVTGVEPMGGAGKAVEADETYYGQVKGEPKRKGGYWPLMTISGEKGPAAPSKRGQAVIGKFCRYRQFCPGSAGRPFSASDSFSAVFGRGTNVACAARMERICVVRGYRA